jgi:metal-responsive CopG/Arc/MetJ family transcriptional regulator
MKTAVSIPDDVFQAADRAAERLGMNRSQLYTQALTAYLADAVGDDLTARLNEIYADEPAGFDGASAGRALIDAGHWQW